jgi:hypothetical protein
MKASLHGHFASASANRPNVRQNNDKALANGNISIIG